MAADTIPSPEANKEEVAEKERRFNTGKAGLTWGYYLASGSILSLSMVFPLAEY